MGDIIQSSPPQKEGAVEAAEYGFAKLIDNHGNSYKSDHLTCAGKPAVTLSFEGDTNLYMAIKHQDEFNFRSDGSIPMVFGMESPLQGMCRRIDAQAHQVPKPKGHTR
jgi:hypothetical protein